MKSEPAVAGEDAILGKARKQILSPVGATEIEQSSGQPFFRLTNDEFSRRHISPTSKPLDSVGLPPRGLLLKSELSWAAA